MARAPLVLLLATAAATSLAGAPQPPTFRAEAPTVSLYTTVVDGNGRLVPDLGRDDFIVLDNGTAQPVTVFARDRQAITIVVMLDRSGSMEGNFGLVREAAGTFVRQLLPADKAKIGSFSQGVRIEPSEFTSDQAELLHILEHDLLPVGLTPLWNATAAAMTALEHEPGRRVVLLFTDGYDSPGTFDPGNATLDQIRVRSRAEETMIYAIGLADDCEESRPASTAGRIRLQLRPPGTPGPIGPGGPLRPGPIGRPPGGSPGPAAPHGDPFGRSPGGDEGATGGCRASGPDPGLKLLAADGGGAYFELHGTDDVSATFTRVADELHQQYLLAFPAPALDGAVHTLEVRLRQPGLHARARTSYVAARRP